MFEGNIERKHIASVHVQDTFIPNEKNYWAFLTPKYQITPRRLDTQTPETRHPDTQTVTEFSARQWPPRSDNCTKSGVPQLS